MAISDRCAWQKAWDNRGLIKSVINERFQWLMATGHTEVMSQEDYWQAAMIGLFRAAKKYDPKRGKFSTYAYRWIYQSISRSFKTSGFKGVRVPDSIYDKISKYKKELGHDFQEWIARSAKPSLRAGYAAMGDCVSFDSKIATENENGSAEIDLKVVYAEESKGWIGQALIDDESKCLLSGALEILSEVERRVIVCRFGLESGEALNVVKVAKLLKMKRRDCLQAEIDAFGKLRNFLKNKGLYNEIRSETRNDKHLETV